MKFVKLALEGAFMIRGEPARDRRGFFARSFCEREFARRGLSFRVRQSNLSYNKKRGTLRGLHYQKPPSAEAKLVMCVKGAAYDVIVDLRRRSPTFGRWVSVELSERTPLALYVPGGFAHGFQTLEDDTTLFYHMSAFHDPRRSVGIRYNDEDLRIRWPLPVSVISKRDR